MVDNPFDAPKTPEPSAPPVVGEASSRRIQISVMERLSKGKELLGEQYLLFVGLCFVGMLVASAVPFAILLGPMACGLHLCCRDRAYGRATKFDQLFKGFDYFMPGFIASLIMVVASFVIMIPLMIVTLVVFGGAVAAAESNDAGGLVVLFTIIPLFAIIMVASMLMYIPFLFSYSLIVDQKMEGWPAVKASWNGAKQNFWGLTKLMFACTLIGFVCLLFCYVPLFFFFPIQLGAFYTVYRDIFPNSSDAHPPKDAAVIG